MLFVTNINKGYFNMRLANKFNLKQKLEMK